MDVLGEAHFKGPISEKGIVLRPVMLQLTFCSRPVLERVRKLLSARCVSHFVKDLCKLWE